MIDIDFKVVYKNLKEVGHKQEPAIPLANLTYFKNANHRSVLGYTYFILHIYIHE